jgi:arylsulfatase A-like enzyme
VTSSRPLRRFALAAALVVAAACGEPQPPPGPPPRQAILILLDATRADRLSTYGYRRATTPRLDALAKEGLVFTRFFSQATYTRASLASLLYSRYFARPVFPASASVPVTDPDELFRALDAEAISLPRALAAAGVHTAAISAHTWITGGSEFAHEFDEFHDLSSELRYKRDDFYPRAEPVIDYTIDWLRRMRDRDFFLYLHLMDMHSPYERNAEARAFFGDSGYDAKAFTPEGRPKNLAHALEGRDREYLDALYDGSLRYADRHLGRLFDALAASGRLATMVIAVTADHGEQLLEQPELLGHGGPWRDVLGRVPFILHAPGRVAPGRTEAFGEMVDVAPTFLGLLGVALPPERRADGLDLVAVARGTLPPREHVFMSEGIRSARWKVLLPPPEMVLGTRPRPGSDLDGELYDLDADPAEVHDLWLAQPDVASNLVAAFRAHMAAPYARYRAATASGPPRTAFAIASRSFLLDRPVPVLPDKPRLSELMDHVGPSGWARSTHPGKHALLARGDAEPLTVEFPVPNGTYALNVVLHGACRLEVAGGPPPVELRVPRNGGARPPETLRDVAAVDVGSVTITDERFRAVFRPLAEAPWLLVRRFGFTPAGAEAGGPDPERERRLRALGYVE